MGDLVRRVPLLNKKDLTTLAELGALNALPEHEHDRHRRGGALWQASAAARPVGELLESVVTDSETSPLEAMTPKQRVYSDFRNSGLTIGRHPLSFYRQQLRDAGMLDSEQVKRQRDGALVSHRWLRDHAAASRDS
jgi:error-prone DNA polymerase